MPNAFANRARELIVGPGSRASFGIGREVGGNNLSRQFRNRHHFSGPFHSWRNFAAIFPVMFGVATDTSGNGYRQISPTLQPLWRSLEGAIDQGARLGTDEWPPTDREHDSKNRQNH